MHRAAAHVVGASLEAFRQVWTGESLHSANITGGLHHAMRERASGFCIYNDVAVGIQYLLDQGAERVAYVDVDAHHGDGVERIFWDDPRVLTISLHETGQMLFPGTGFPNDVGGPGARGSAVNVALPPGTADAGWLRAFHAVVPPLVREFKPEVLVTQHGCDSHMEDPLAHLMLSVDGQRASYLALHDLAHEVAAGRWVALGGGGYALVEVVPRAWTHLLAIVARAPPRPGHRDPGRLAPAHPHGPGPHGAAPPHRRSRLRPTATGRRATTRTPGWTGPSTRPGPTRSRCTASIRCRENGPEIIESGEIKGTRRRLTQFRRQPLPHESLQALFSPHVMRAITGGEAGGGSRRKSVPDAYHPLRRPLRVEVPHRRGGRGDDAGLQDDGLPPRPRG